MSGPVQHPQQPSEPRRIDDSRVIEAEIADLLAQTDLRKLEGEDNSRQITANIEHRKDQQRADNQDREMRTGSELNLAEEMAKAAMSDQELRTAAGIEDLRRQSVTTQFERFFFMGIVAVGIVATIALAFMTADQGGWEYRLSPLAGLLISGGGGLKLRSLVREQRRPISVGDARYSWGRAMRR